MYYYAGIDLSLECSSVTMECCGTVLRPCSFFGAVRSTRICRGDDLLDIGEPAAFGESALFLKTFWNNCQLAFLMSFDEVVIALFITGPETTTLPVKMYSSVQWEISPVIAAVSALLTMLSIVFCGVSIFLLPGAAEPSR
ncbi:ABC transporter permease [Bradyrhizobium sp. PMVTL-01]|uniref:ABC transporter permease n=1 Tax=Bradyrhizobium sp. PMVTL-01 TaxID=3434999 RepID=UPI003F6FB4AB